MNPKGKIYDSAGTFWSRFAAGVSILAVLATVVITGFSLRYHRENAQAALLTLAALWAVGAPLWFFIDYYFIYRARAADDSWELFKHGQQVSIAVWAGFTAALYALGSSDLAKPEKVKAECTIVVPVSVLALGGTVSVVLECKSK